MTIVPKSNVVPVSSMYNELTVPAGNSSFSNIVIELPSIPCLVTNSYAVNNPDIPAPIIPIDESELESSDDDDDDRDDDDADTTK